MSQHARLGGQRWQRGDNYMTPFLDGTEGKFSIAAGPTGGFGGPLIPQMDEGGRTASMEPIFVKLWQHVGMQGPSLGAGTRRSLFGTLYDNLPPGTSVPYVHPWLGVSGGQCSKPPHNYCTTLVVQLERTGEVCGVTPGHPTNS